MAKNINHSITSLSIGQITSTEPKPEALPFIQNFETDYYSSIEEDVIEDLVTSNKNNQSIIEDTSEIESFLIENTCPKSRGCRCVCDDFGND